MVEHFAHEPVGHSRRHGAKVLRVFGLALAGIGMAALFAALFGWLVQILWNWLMPAVFGLKTITFWQGFGILLLAKLLFGGVAPGRRRHRERWGRRFRERVHGADPGEEGDPDAAPMPGDGRRWPMFRRYWREEGRSAFEAYVQKTKPQDEK
ncbi:MAG: hypothetical protein ABSA30_06485 [Candidatus Aminicenantales bacterium]|jgi:hypothetical protein